MLVISEVCATVRIVAFHRWPDAPEDVVHLAARHRHVLTVRVWCVVEHADRAVEFHQLQRSLRGLLTALYPSRNVGELELGARSCEHVARDVLEHTARLQAQAVRVEVWEDDENGATVSRRAP